MKNHNIYYVPLLLGGLLAASACTDDKYDLSDIDTTTSVKLDGLVLPVNLESIYLDQVLKVDDEDPENPIIIDTDSSGKKIFAIQKGGEFSAQPVYLEMIDADSYASVPSLPVVVSGTSISPAEVEYVYMIGEGKVDDSIEKIYRLGMHSPMEIKLDFYYSNSGMIPVVNDLVLSIPESFTAFYKGNEFSNGEVAVKVVDGSLDEPIYVYSIDFGGNGIEPTGSNGQKSLTFSGKIGIKTGNVSSGNDNLFVDFTMSPFVADQISGSINYEIDAPEFEPVSLSDLPDFLRDGESRLILNNPQLYLYFGNPTGAPFHTGLIITPEGNNGSMLSFEMNPFEESIILAPDIDNLALKNDYPGATLQEETGLSVILLGDGLPEYINFQLSTTYLRGNVPNLTLGTEMQVEGNYQFYSPLSFGQGSQILYQKAETDFFGEDAKAVKVSQLQLSAYPSTNLPFDLELTVYPLDKDGNHIYDKNGAEVKASGIVEANANGSKILDINLNQPFTGLDGVEYRVSAMFPNEESLSPDQFIKLDKIRAKVTGEYVTEL